MEYLLQVPLERGGHLLVEAAIHDFPSSDLELAAGNEDAGGLLIRGRRTLEHAIAELEEPLRVVLGRLQALSPDEGTVEFGLNLASEAGVVVAKGTAGVNFKVTLKWAGAPALQK